MINYNLITSLGAFYFYTHYKVLVLKGLFVKVMYVSFFHFSIVITHQHKIMSILIEFVMNGTVL